MASRFLSSIWALFALVFCASYTANLAAFMIAKKEYYDLKGLKDWRLNYPWNHKPPFRFATVPYGATEETIHLNYPNMHSYMRNFNKSSVEEGIKALKSGELDAFIYDATVLDYRVMQDDHCELRTVGNVYAMTGYGLGLPKNSRWYKRIDDQLLEYMRNGKLHKWQKFWFTGACKATADVGNTNKTLGVKNFISAFVLLLTGIMFCVLLLLGEHFFYRYGRKKLTTWDKYHCCGLISVSMGQLLSFEQSVNTTVCLLKHHKCSNPICETQMWKVRLQLVQAQKRIHQLETALTQLSAQLQIYGIGDHSTEPVNHRAVNERRLVWHPSKSIEPLDRITNVHARMDNGSGLLVEPFVPSVRRSSSRRRFSILAHPQSPSAENKPFLRLPTDATMEDALPLLSPVPPAHNHISFEPIVWLTQPHCPQTAGRSTILKSLMPHSVSSHSSGAATFSSEPQYFLLRNALNSTPYSKNRRSRRSEKNTLTIAQEHELFEKESVL